MAGEHGRILVVDDNRMNRLKLSLGLEQQGHTVALAEDGVQALEMIRSQPPDVVLLDIVMPGMDGFQVLECVKADSEMRDIPVIVISALEEIDSAVRCIEMGAEDYLPKPFNPVLLRARLNSSLQKKRLRDLEKAYLQQEVMLRQSEKLATLGKLSAGMAHELNNPAAAAGRSASQLHTAFSRIQHAFVRLAAAGLSSYQLESMVALDTQARERSSQPVSLDPLARSDRESQLERWLEARGVASAWEMASNMVGLGYEVDQMEKVAETISSDVFPGLAEWLHCTAVIYSLLMESGHSAARISRIVDALKAYTHLDQAPVQNVDLHEGLENTLVVLRSKLEPGVTVHRQYSSELPRIEGLGAELNQVWTNLIDNAIDAIEGSGEITLRTRHDQQWVLIDVEDNGPGIPDEILPRIFDPFFTTKPPGKGAGLGLNICHNIVVQKHKGRIEVHSQPGATQFRVHLPIDAVPVAA